MGNCQRFGTHFSQIVEDCMSNCHRLRSSRSRSRSRNPFSSFNPQSVNIDINADILVNTALSYVTLTFPTIWFLWQQMMEFTLHTQQAFKQDKWDLHLFCPSNSQSPFDDDLQCYSQSRRLLSYRPFPKKPVARTPPQRPFLPVARIDSQWTHFCSTGIVPVKIMERSETVRPAALWIAL